MNPFAIERQTFGKAIHAMVTDQMKTWITEECKAQDCTEADLIRAALARFYELPAAKRKVNN